MIDVVTILIIGDGWKKPFDCYGRKNVNKVCAQCVLKFKCFTQVEQIELTPKEIAELSNVRFEHDSDAATMARFLTKNIKPTMVKRDDGGELISVAQLNFEDEEKI